MVYDVSGSKIGIFVKVFETIILFLTLSVINAVKKSSFAKKNFRSFEKNDDSETTITVSVGFA